VAFSLTDFKKTSRTVDGRHVLYPHQLRDDRFLAAISYAIDYYERMVGRPRHELQSETLLEFFGDPKLARGIIACLGRSYVWHTPAFEELLDPHALDSLRRRELTTSIALRAHLYRYANQHYGGFLATDEREQALETMCSDLAVDRSTFERLLVLDAPGNAILTKLHMTPDARDIVSLYNYHSYETALRYADRLRLTLTGDMWPAIRTLHNLARRYGLQYEVDHGTQGMLTREVHVTLTGVKDALGTFRGSGRRIVRVLLRLLAAHPKILSAADARVHLRGRTSQVLLDARALRTLGAQAPATGGLDDAWEAEEADTLRIAWSRAFMRGETAGWRLRRDPEPLVTEHGVIVPDYGLHRGAQRASLVVARTASAVDALVKPLKALGGRSLVVVATRPELVRKLAGLHAMIVPSEDAPVPRLLATALPSPVALAERHTTKWQHLERILAAEGFVDEGRIGEVLEIDVDRVEQAVRGWRAGETTYLPGIGLCTPETLGEIRALLQPARQKAA
jgi:predicted nuclease of restriction endonuclease-like RecB superfamily